MADDQTNGPKKRKSLFSGLFGSQSSDLLVEHVLREVKAGRGLADILEDPYIRNRADERQRRALLDDPRVTEAVSVGVLNNLRSRLDS